MQLTAAAVIATPGSSPGSSPGGSDPGMEGRSGRRLWIAASTFGLLAMTLPAESNPL